MRRIFCLYKAESPYTHPRLEMSRVLPYFITGILVVLALRCHIVANVSKNYLHQGNIVSIKISKDNGDSPALLSQNDDNSTELDDPSNK